MNECTYIIYVYMCTAICCIRINICRRKAYTCAIENVWLSLWHLGTRWKILMPWLWGGCSMLQSASRERGGIKVKTCQWAAAFRRCYLWEHLLKPQESPPFHAHHGTSVGKRCASKQNNMRSWMSGQWQISLAVMSIYLQSNEGIPSPYVKSPMQRDFTRWGMLRCDGSLFQTGSWIGSSSFILAASSGQFRLRCLSF